MLDKKPTPEELANLSRLYNQIRALKLLRDQERNKLFKPIDERIKEIQLELFHKYDKHVERLADEILATRNKLRLNYGWSHGYDLKRFR